MSRSFRRDRGPCEAVVDGRVFVYPFGNFSGPQDIPPMLLNDVRQELLQDVLAASGRLDAPMVCGAPYLVPYCMADGGRTCLYLVNGALDAVENIVLHVGGGGVPCGLPHCQATIARCILPRRSGPACASCRLPLRPWRA